MPQRHDLVTQARRCILGRRHARLVATVTVARVAVGRDLSVEPPDEDLCGQRISCEDECVEIEAVRSSSFNITERN